MALGKHGFALTPLTADKTTRLQRNAGYKKIEQADIDYFRSIYRHQHPGGNPHVLKTHIWVT
ncbi:unnamed protein product [Umbelopsis ramanniana]